MPAQEIEEILVQHRDRMVAASLSVGIAPAAIWCFGSAASGELREDSDLDFVVLFRSENELRAARPAVLGAPRIDMWPLDVLLYTEADFGLRAERGGVCMIVRDEGRRLYP